MARTPRTAAAEPTAEAVDPIEPSPTDASQEAQDAPSEAPEHDNEPSAGASTPVTQDAETLHPDTNTAPNEHAVEAFEKPADEASAKDPILPERADEPVAGATDKVSVKTTGDFLLMDPFTGKHFDQHEATETPCTQWVQDQLDRKRLVKA